MRPTLFQRRTVWFPTLLGWLCLAVAAALPILLWWFKGEEFLAVTRRQPAEILVVEGWIGSDGIRDAGAEFAYRGYTFIVTTSSVATTHWDSRHESYAEIAKRELVHMGIPPERILVAIPRETERQRTYESAAAVARVLREQHLQPSNLNVFTMSVHARRSGLVFAKVLGPDIQVGTIAWRPIPTASEPWWYSTERADDFMKETVGFALEALFSSFRSSNPPADAKLGEENGVPHR